MVVRGHAVTMIKPVVIMIHRVLKAMFVVLAVILVYVIILTFTTGYITHSTRNKISKVALPNTKGDEALVNNDADYIFNCTNIATIKLVRLLGSGIYTNTYLGEYGTGTKVAVKMLNTKPRKKLRGHQLQMFMKEILLLQQLKHRNILKLLGFCIRSETFGSESLKDEGALAVYEYGEEVYSNTSFFMHLPFPQRLDIALAITDLFIYLENSPLGSIRMFDIALRHFLWNNNTLKMIDLDGSWQEPSCQSTNNASCEFNVTCVEARYVGHNAKHNLLRVKQVLLERLLMNVDTLVLEGNTTDHGIRWRRYGLDALKQLIIMLKDNPYSQQLTFTWVRQRLLDARSAL